MILYKEDWAKHPGAFPDFTTNNKSALKFVKLLMTMGVDNYLWPLALHNRDLIGVDPRGTGLSQKQRMMIAIECKENPWYFFREVYKLPSVSGNSHIDFRLNRAIWRCTGCSSIT